MVYPTPRYVREMATVVVDTEDGERAQYYLRRSLALPRPPARRTAFRDGRSGR